MNCFRFSQASVHRPVPALWWWLGWSQRMFARWLLLFALLPLAWRTAAADSDWAAGWTRCPSPSANWRLLDASSDASVIAAIGLINDEETGLPNRVGAVSDDFGRSWRLMSSPPEEVVGQWKLFSEGPFALSADGSFMAIAGSRRSVSPDGTSVSEAVLVTSDDRGTTWSRRGFPPEVARNAEILDLALSRDGRHILAAVAGVACLSQDRGQTWQVVVPSDGGSISGVAVSANGNTLAVSLQSADEVKLLLSTDTGATWSRLNWHGVGTPRFLTLLEPGDRGLRMAAALEDSISVSEDQGKSWRNLPLKHMPSAFAVTPDGVQVLSVPPLDWTWPANPVSFSTDSGATWQNADLGWVKRVAMSEDSSIQVAALDSGVILINGVLYPPAILNTRRQGDLGLVGDRSVTLGVEATGGHLSYQWRQDGNPLADRPGRSGTQSAELNLTSASEADLGTYSVVVSNAAGSVEQQVFTLKLEAPTVSSANQMGSTALVDGAPVTFRVDATGGLLSFRWRHGGVDLEDASGRTGSHTRELVLTSASSADLGIYSLIVSNAMGSVVTNVGELKLTLPRLIASGPGTNVFVTPDASVQLLAQVEGGEIEVEWLLNGQPLGPLGSWNGPGKNVLSFIGTPASALGQYSVRLRNPLGELVADIAQVGHASWTQANVPMAGWKAVAISATGDRIVACAPDRVYASGDEAKTWKPWPVPGTDWSSVALGHLSGSVVLAQGNSAYGPAQPTFGYRSTDEGDTWTPWNQGQDGDPSWRTTSVASSADGQSLLTTVETPAAGPFGLPIKWGFLRFSHDGGRTWQKAGGDIFIAYGMSSATCSDDGQCMAAIRDDFFEGFSIKFSRDGGATWQTSTLPEPVMRAVKISGDGQRLVVIAGQHLYACDSGSLAWQRLTAPAANWVALALSHDGRRVFAADTGLVSEVGVIYQSDDGGQTWRWSGSPSANWTAIACSADGERVVGVSSQGLFLAPGMATSTDAAVPLPAISDTSGLHFLWRGIPHRTYRLFSTPNLNAQAWQSAGASVADPAGRVSVIDGANASQRFWQAVEAP